MAQRRLLTSFVQRMQAPGDPTNFLFLHQTVSEEFSQGAHPGDPGQRLEAVAAQIREGVVDPLTFPPLSIFTITDPDGLLGTETYSLNNRRLYVFKKAGVQAVNIRRATLQEVLGSLWKMTNESGGYYYPNLTHFGDKDAVPGGLLGKFRTFCEKFQNLPTFAQMVINNFGFH
jgi:hypothetical protein